MLTILRPVRIGRRIDYVCRCQCGQETTVTRQNLRSGNTTSCGCKRQEPTFGGKGGRTFARSCRRCGVPFVGTAKQLFCGEHCCNRYHIEIRWPKSEKRCPICGVRFAGRAERIYCDARCRRVASNQRTLAKRGKSSIDHLPMIGLALRQHMEDQESGETK